METTNMKVHSKGTVGLVYGAAATLLIAGAISLAAPQQANAKPEFAAQTGKPCGQCHVNPGGGGKLKPFGEKFKANGFKIK
jgi:hypothetical protein